MDLMQNKKAFREFVKQVEVANTVNGGIAQTAFNIHNVGNDILVEVSNASVSPDAFTFTINGDQLIINVMHHEKGAEGKVLQSYPLFLRIVKIPYFVDINKIEASYEQGIFKILLPYNKNLPNQPFRINIKNLDI